MDARHLLVCLFIGLIDLSAGGWVDINEPFKEFLHEDVTIFVTDRDNTRIEMLEERVNPTKIAIINYDGVAADPPVIESFDEGKDNTMLGADHVLEDNVWYLVITKPQDYEIKQQQLYGFYYNTGIGGVNHRVIIRFKNINDNAPQLSPLNSNCIIVENDVYPESDCIFTVFDADGRTEWPFTAMKYGITGSTKASDLLGFKHLEEVNEYNARATLTVAAPGLDFEEFSVHIIELFVEDDPLNVTNNVGTTSYVVRVEDVADEPPFWKTPIIPQTLLEEESHTIQVSAADGDIGINAEIGYKLDFRVGSGDEVYFSIDQSSGLISVAVIDRDILESDIFEFTVTAYELVDEASSITSDMFVIIKDINDNEPTITANTLEVSIDEETAVQLPLDVNIADPDLASFGSFTIELKDDYSGHEWHNNFLLIPTNGYQSSDLTISVKNPAALDYEVDYMRIITLQLVTIENANPSHMDIQNITIRLIDLNDEFPEFGEEQYFASIEENSKAGVSITVVLALDPDEGDIVTHSLTSQLSIMNIDSLTGEITVASDTAFDYERQTTVVVQILAEDLVGHRTFVQLTVAVIDVNDVQPDLTMPSTQPWVMENSPVALPIDADIFASDVDTDASLEFSIEWDKSFATKQGARVQDTSLFEGFIEITTVYPDVSDTGKANGFLTVSDHRLDYESYDFLTLSIKVTDLNTAPGYPQSVSRSALLAIELKDENDNWPIFTDDSIDAVRSVIEASRTDWLIGSAIATDADGPGNNQVTYTIEEADPRLPPNLVRIDSDKGELRVQEDRAIDCDTDYEDKLFYIVTATDGLWNTTLAISIDIVDTNNRDPQVFAEEVIIPIREDATSGTFVVHVTGTDADFTRPYHTISYFMRPLLNSEIFDLFSIDEITGIITVDLKHDSYLDRDNGILSHSIPVVLRDNYNQPDSNSAISNINDTLIITVELLDVNDNDPILEVITGCIEEFLDEAPVGTVIYSNGILATDKDYMENGTVTFSILSEERVSDGVPITPLEDLFEINTINNRGYLKTRASVKNFWGEYLVTLMATDHGPSGEERNGTGIYRICILPMNDHPPVITYPTATQNIRLRLEQNLNGPLIDSNGTPLRDFVATDADQYGENGRVTLTLEGTGPATEYFHLVDKSATTPNSAQLQLKKDLNEDERVFQLQIVAKDHGVPQREASVVAKVVVIIRMNVEPEFEVDKFEPWFVENSPGERATIPTAIDEDNFELPVTDDEWQAIYYYITSTEAEAPGLRYFALDKTTGVLSLTEPLNREDIKYHVLTIVASNKEVTPSPPLSDKSILIVNVTVQDTNDNPPMFVQGIFPGGVYKDDLINKPITTIKAEDPDLNDTVTYEIVPNTMYISDSSLNNVNKETAFILNSAVGGDVVLLNFQPDATMKGYFLFNVTAFDKLGPAVDHEDFAQVKIYMITDQNRVTFKFLNERNDIDTQKQEVEKIFTDVLGSECATDSVYPGSDSSGNPVLDETFVIAHFVDNDEPVDNSVITDLVTNREIAVELKRLFLNLPKPLLFADYILPVPEKNTEALLRIILIVVSVVLGTLVILLFAAFFIKTRSLNRRLEALSTTKFGSQDSGLNRVGMSMPGTNKTALEGSNPVWNEDIHAKEFDNVSQGSYESGMVGIEESPEFNAPPPRGHDNVAYNSDARPSINPLGNGTLSDYENMNYEVPGNFTFAKKNDDIPITDL